MKSTFTKSAIVFTVSVLLASCRTYVERPVVVETPPRPPVVIEKEPNPPLVIEKKHIIERR